MARWGRGPASLDPTPPLTPKRFGKILGPGLITGASDDDPAGIAVYAQAGATYKYSGLWTVLLCLPLMMAVQQICDQTALATGRGLGKLIRDGFGMFGKVAAFVLMCALLVANLINIAADLMAIGSGMNLVHAGPATLWTVISGVALMALVAAGSFDAVSRVLRLLCLSLLAYPIVLMLVNVDWGQVALGSIGLAGGGGSGYWQIVVAALGTTLSPYLLFWQSSNRAEEIRELHEKGKAAKIDDEVDHKGKRRLVIQDRLDVAVGMIFSEIVAFSIIAATAATVGQSGKQIQTAADAAQAFEPLAGQAATWLFAAGFVGTGLLAVPVLAGSAASAIAGLLNRPWGFAKEPKRAPAFYILVALGTLGGTVLAALSADPIHLLVLSGLINGIGAAPFILLALLVARNRTLMNGHEIGLLATIFGWIAVLAMAAAGVVGIATA